MGKVLAVSLELEYITSTSATQVKVPLNQNFRNKKYNN